MTRDRCGGRRRDPMMEKGLMDPGGRASRWGSPCHGLIPVRVVKGAPNMAVSDPRGVIDPALARLASAGIHHS